MKISKITPYVMGTPWRELVFVKVETDEGLYGLGEARPLGRTDTMLGYLKEITPHVLGMDPFNIEYFLQQGTRFDYGRKGEIAMTGLALIEVACWDIMGKALNQPVYRLLGGAVRDKIKAYANGWYRVERTPEEFHQAAKEVAARGYKGLKFDPFGAGFYELDRAEKIHVVSLVEAVYDAVGPEVEILIEMHGRFNPVTAVEMAKELARFKPAWIEEPVPPENMKALRDVREAVLPMGIPVATGERIHTTHDYRELFEERAADILQVDITHFGGLLNTKKLAATADMYYMLMAPHNVGGPVSTAASLHFAASTNNFKIQEFFNDFADRHVMDAAPGVPPVVDGYFALPEGPGLGVELNEDVIAASPRQEVKFNLFQEGWQLRDKRK